MNTNDIRYLIAAAILTASIFMMSYGVTWAIYPAMAYLTLNSWAILLASSVYMNPDVFIRVIIKHSATSNYRNHAVQFLIHITTAAFLYQAYLMGYAFTVGFFTFMLSMSVLSNIMTFLTPKG